MSASPEREEFEIAPAETNEEGELTSGESLLFSYEHPFIDVESSTRTVTHEPIDEEPVIQELGPEIREITIEGHCYLDEAIFIDGLIDGGLIEVVSDRWSGYGVVKRASTKATGEGGGARNGVENRIYDYRLVVAELTDNRPDSVGAI